MSLIVFVVVWALGLLRVDLASEIVGYDFIDFSEIQFGKKRLIRAKSGGIVGIVPPEGPMKS